MRIGAHTIIHHQDGQPSYRSRHLLLTDTPTPALAQLMRLPDTDLRTGTAPILARPLSAPALWVYHHQMVQQATVASVGCLVGLMTVGSFTVAVAALGALAGTHGLAVNAGIAVVAVAAYTFYCARLQVQALAVRAGYVLCDAYVALGNTPADEDMAEQFADYALDAVLNAGAWGVVDPRLFPAAKQYVEAYNDKFGGEHFID